MHVKQDRKKTGLHACQNSPDQDDVLLSDEKNEGINTEGSGKGEEGSRSPKPHNRPQKSKGKSIEVKGLLAKIVLDGRNQNKSAFQSLNEAGWIGSIKDYL